MRKYLILALLSTTVHGMDSREPLRDKEHKIIEDKDELSDFEIIDSELKDSKAVFSSLTEHNQKMSMKIKSNLIVKGYDLLQQIREGETLTRIDHKIEFFPNAGCDYVEGVQNWTHKGPNMKSVWNVCTSYFQKPEDIDKKKQKTEERRAMLESLIAVVWAISDHAFKIGQGFSSGSFSIIDNEGHLFNFFAQYALWVNEVPDLKDLPYGSLNPVNPYGNPFAYNRDPQTPLMGSSSHYKQTTIHQLGIDARFESNALTISAFPYRGSHIIVGRVKTQTGLDKTMIKYESHGLGDVSSWLSHGVEFIKSQHDRENKRSEKDIPIKIKNAFSNIISNIAFSNLQESNIEVVNQMIQEGKALASDEILKKYDLSSWIAFALHVKNEQEEIVENAVNTFLQIVEETYHDGLFSDNPTKAFYRTGNEVVLDLREIVSNDQ